MAEITLDLEYISNTSINRAIEAINNVDQSEELEISYFSYGGDVLSSMQLGRVLQQREKPCIANISGLAASIGVGILPFFDRVKVSNRSQFILHPVTANNGQLKENVANDLFDILKSAINLERFEEIADMSLKMVLNGDPWDETFEIILNAEQMLYIGLADEIYSIDPAARNNVDNVIANGLNFHKIKPKEANNIFNKNIERMDKQTFKANHSELYNQIISEAATEERQRITILNEFKDVVPERVQNYIEEGKPLDAAFNISVKNALKNTAVEKGAVSVLNNIENDNAENIEVADDSTNNNKVLNQHESNINKRLERLKTR